MTEFRLKNIRLSFEGRYINADLSLVDCEWRGAEAKLVLHHEDGFTLLSTHEAAGSRGRVLWTQPFHKLVMSSDDGARLIWLRFDGDMEVVSYRHN